MCFARGKEIHFGGFVRGLLGILGQTRVWFCAGFRGCNPYTEGLKSNFEANWKLNDFADFFY